MTNAAQDSLHSLLFKEGKELENIKFFPGTDRGLTAEKLRNAADAVIRAALDKGPVDDAPVTGRQKTTI